MTASSRHSTMLELDKILALLAEETTCPDARAMALQLQPQPDFASASRQLQRTVDANTMTNRFGTPGLGGIGNPSGMLKRAQLGASLTIRELLAVASVLRAVRNLAGFRRQWEEPTSLDDLFESLTPFRNLEDDIDRAILTEEELADSASPDLAAIRRKIQRTEASIRTSLEKIIRSPSYQKVLQEQIITIRDGRFVVPVKSEFRSELKGLVHDTSSSGATLFIEPMAVVEANNEIRVLRGQEKEEIDRILAELSAQVGAVAQQIGYSYEAAVELDLYFAKSRLADKMRAAPPILGQDGVIDLKKARHPLIAGDKIVPIDIRLGGDFDTLVITGPNTGGKTVALKTLGLFTLMAMCGLFVPAADGSRLSVFDHVLADIGDEQSIEQSLSTFSAHMTNIVTIFQAADRHSLVLLDELGAGTDPVEGAALAVSIIESLRERGATVAATTHYAEIKAYALKTDGVENASCEFDVATLSPTYRLLIGIPGRSNAFAISKRLGLAQEIIDRAEDHLSTDSQRFEDVVGELDQLRQQLEQEKTEAAVLRRQAQQLREEAEKERLQLEKDKEHEIERAKNQAQGIIAQVRRQSEELIDQLNEALKEKNQQNFTDLAQKAKVSFKTDLHRLEEVADPILKKSGAGYTLPRPLKRGDRVQIVQMGREGTVLSGEDGQGYVQVQAGILKTKVHKSELRLLDSSKKKVTVGGAPYSRRGITSKTERSARTEIDLRGMTVDEALMVLDKEIDNAVLANLKTVTIIHGKGTGALRSAVQQHLRRHKSVASFRLGVYGEGESGVTIAELK